MAFNPVNLGTATVGILGTMGVGAHQFPTRWRQYVVQRLPQFLGNRVDQIQVLKKPLWKTAVVMSVTGSIAGSGLISFALLVEECSRAITFCAVIIAPGLQRGLLYILPAERVPKNLFEVTLMNAHVLLDYFSAIRKSAIILTATSVTTLLALGTLGRMNRFSLDVLFPPYPKSDDISLVRPSVDPEGDNFVV